MLEASFERAVLKLARGLEDATFPWIISGSAGLALQGMNLRPGDIDLETTESGAYAVENAFERYVRKRVSFSSQGNLRSHYGVLGIEGVQVEIVGALQVRFDQIWSLPRDLNAEARTVLLCGWAIPVLNAEHEQVWQRKIGRTAKADEIQEFLRSQS